MAVENNKITFTLLPINALLDIINTVAFLLIHSPFAGRKSVTLTYAKQFSLMPNHLDRQQNVTPRS